MDTSRPYNEFNFLVELDNEMQAGFSEVSGLSADVLVAEYRSGISATGLGYMRPVAPTIKSITLRHGIVGELEFYKWLEKCCVGGQWQSRRNLIIKLLGGDRKTIQQRWRLTGVMPMKCRGSQLQAKGRADVVIDELVLAVEGLTIE